MFSILDKAESTDCKICYLCPGIIHAPMKDSFFELLQIAVGRKSMLTRRLNEGEWSELYDECGKQALSGICFVGITKLPESQRPPIMTIIQWAGKADAIRRQNLIIDTRCRCLTEKLKEEGMWSCILKGQTNRFNYPKHLWGYRSPGDIDVWVTDSKKLEYYSPEHDAKALLHACRLCDGKIGRYGLIHASVPLFRDCEVELHFRPSYFYSPIYDKRFHKWLETQYPALRREEDGMSIASNDFNTTYQMIHIFNHFCNGGIGMRQVTDYFFLLKKAAMDGRRKKDIMKVMSKLGMKKFAAGMMYVLQKALKMEEEDMLCTPDKRNGEFILSEIMKGGNFGWYDKRLGGMKLTKTGRRLRLAVRLSKLMIYFPQHIIWYPRGMTLNRIHPRKIGKYLKMGSI